MNNENITEFVNAIYTDTTALDTQTSEPISPSEVDICGFVIEETDEYITLAMEVTESGDYRGQVSIPINTIKKMKRYEL